MAAVSITAANVAPSTGAVIEHHTAGASITAGQVVYYDSADGRVKLVDADSATSAARSPRGIALHAASSGQPVAVQVSGNITIGGTVVQGLIYCADDDAGGIIPSADLASGDYTTVIGVAISASVLKMGILHAGVAI